MASSSSSVSNAEGPGPLKEQTPEVLGNYQIKDGGREAWCTMFGGLLSLTAVYGYQNAFGVYQDLYTRSGAASPQGVSWIGSTQLALMVALGLPAGKLLDSGYFRITTFIGSLIYVFSLFMVSIAHPDKYYQLFLSQGLGMGIGTGLIYVPSLAVQAHHWKRNRPLAMGVVISGSSIGGIFFPIMLNQLFKSQAGFAWGVRASAFVVLGLLIPANILMTARPLPKELKRPPPALKVLLSDIPYVLGTLGGTIADWGFFFPYFYLQLFAILKGVDHNKAFYLLAVLNAASIPGRLVPNVLGQKFGVFNVLCFCCLVCGALIFAMFGINTFGEALVFAILYGFFSGGFLSLLSPAIAVLAKDESEMGVRLGLAYFITSVGALTGPPIDGALLGTTFPWWRPITWSGVTVIVGLVSLLGSRHLVGRRKGSSWI